MIGAGKHLVGSWEGILDRLGWRLQVEHQRPERVYMLRDIPRARRLCYFVGGPWDTRLEWVDEYHIGTGHFDVIDPPPTFGSYWMGHQVTPADVAIISTRYRIDFSLPTGVTVFSCLRF